MTGCIVEVSNYFLFKFEFKFMDVVVYKIVSAEKSNVISIKSSKISCFPSTSWHLLLFSGCWY